MEKGVVSEAQKKNLPQFQFLELHHSNILSDFFPHFLGLQTVTLEF